MTTLELLTIPGLEESTKTIRKSREVEEGRLTRISELLRSPQQTTSSVTFSDSSTQTARYIKKI